MENLKEIIALCTKADLLSIVVDTAYRNGLAAQLGLSADVVRKEFANALAAHYC